MDLVDINVAIIGWISFWVTYWTVGSFITWRCHVTGIRKVTELKEVIANLSVNMMWSLIGSIILCFQPLRALTDSHIIVKIMVNYLMGQGWDLNLDLNIKKVKYEL